MSFIQIIYDEEASDDLSAEKLQDTSTLMLEDLNVVNDTSDDNTGQNLLVNTKNVLQVEETPNIVEWTKKETNYLLKKYNKYIVCTGPKKRFRTKRELWQLVSQDIKLELKINRSAAQCENRYKTILRKWRKQAGQESNDDTETVFTNHNKPSSSRNETIEISNKKDKSLADVLWEIFKRKEEGRERRHKEKMELIKSLLQNLD